MSPKHPSRRLFVMGSLLLMMLTGALCIALLCFLATAIMFDSLAISLCAAVISFAWALIFAFSLNAEQAPE